MPEYYHTRVNSKKSQPDTDFSKFMRDITSYRKASWDKDKGNKLCKGDYLGFITGPTGHELVYIFKVISEHPSSDRPNHWVKGKPHTIGNGKYSVDNREVIELSNNHSLPKTIEWKQFREITGLGKNCKSWMPRGTQRIRDKTVLPFNL
jgi:hypothetical protein